MKQMTPDVVREVIGVAPFTGAWIETPVVPETGE